MLEIIADNLEVQAPPTGDVVLAFKASRDSWDAIYKHMDTYRNQKKKLCVNIKFHSEQRSLNANSYFWRLCTLIAAKLNVDKDDIYRRFVKEAAIADAYIDKSWENEKLDGITKMWSGRGTGWVCEVLDKGEEYSLLRLYMGSSQYNSLQMYHLIQKAIREAEDMRIPTITDKEAKKLADRWKPK